MNGLGRLKKRGEDCRLTTIQAGGPASRWVAEVKVKVRVKVKGRVKVKVKGEAGGEKPEARGLKLNLWSHGDRAVGCSRAGSPALQSILRFQFSAFSTGSGQHGALGRVGRGIGFPFDGLTALSGSKGSRWVGRILRLEAAAT